MTKPQNHLTDKKEYGTTGKQPVYGDDPRANLLAGLPVTERRLRLHGISTAVLEGGDGPPVILLHGPGEYAAKWFRIIPDLVKTNRVIAPDLPGHGSSEPVDGPLDESVVIDWLDELIKSTCHTKPALVGQILGGAIAARFAASRGESINSLILADSLGLAEFQPAPEFGRALGEFMSNPKEDTHDRFWSYCAYDLDKLRDNLGDRWEWIKAYNLDRAQTPELAATQHALMENFGLPSVSHEELEGIDVPTTLIWGKHDLATPLPVARTVSAKYRWPLHVIDSAADDPPLEQPDAFLDILIRTLHDSNSRKRAAVDTRVIRDAWSKIAPGFDMTNTSTQMIIAAEGLRLAGLRAGMRFLDVASGSGALSIPAARIGARVTAVDLSPIMLELLEKRARREGLNIETREMDGHALELDDNSFDMAGSQFGVMLFPDLPKGVREMARVVRPGGKVLINAYGNPNNIEFLQFFTESIQSVRPEFTGLPTDPPPLEFQLSNPERMRRELNAAGLKKIKVETVTETTEYQTGKDLWEWILWSNPIAEYVLTNILQLTDDERKVVRNTLDQLFQNCAGENGKCKLTNPINIGIGTK